MTSSTGITGLRAFISDVKTGGGTLSEEQEGRDYPQGSSQEASRGGTASLSKDLELSDDEGVQEDYDGLDSESHRIPPSGRVVGNNPSYAEGTGTGPRCQTQAGA